MISTVLDTVYDFGSDSYNAFHTMQSSSKGGEGSIQKALKAVCWGWTPKATINVLCESKFWIDDGPALICISWIYLTF